MFELNVGSTPCQVTPAEYKQLAAKTDGCATFLFTSSLNWATTNISALLRYSGSDIAIVVRDALMQPVRKVLAATHFKSVSVTDPTTNETTTKLTPCSPGDPEAEEKTWTDIGTEELLEPPLKIGDFLNSIASVRPSVAQGDIQKHIDWTSESGADGA